MADVALSFDHVYKKFRRGELYDSLRDLIPSLARRWVSGPPTGGLARREFWAVEDLSFEVPKGEAFGIVGANGAGKSTVLKLLAGILRPTTGAISVRGRLSALIEVGAGFHPDLTGRENIYLSGTILGMRRQEIARKFDRIVEFSGLAEFIDTPVKRYSSGMFARLGFAVAAHVDPDILIVDEVLSVGDYVFQQRCMERMDEIIHGGATVIFVSHNMRSLTDLCSRGILLERGRLVASGPAGEVVRTYMQRATALRRTALEREIEITEVRVRGTGGERVEFRSGDKAWVDVTVRARQPHEKIAVVLQITDEDNYVAFNTSSERLGTPPATLGPGDTWRVSFELDLHLGYGTYHLGVFLYRYDIERQFDHWFPAATIFVSPEQDVLGPSQLYPRVVRSEISR